MSAFPNMSDARMFDNAESYKFIFEQSPVGLARTDLNGRFVQVNPKFSEITGRSESELRTLRIQDITHSDDLENNVALLAETIRTGKVSVIEKRYIRPDGTPIWVNNTISTIRDPNGRPQFIITAAQELTAGVLNARTAAGIGLSDDERERLLTQVRDLNLVLEERVQERTSELVEVSAKFKAIYDQGLFAGFLDLDGTVIDVNRSCLEQCGFTRDDVIGKPFWECGWWNRSPEIQNWMRDAVALVAQGQLFRGESKYFVADGSERIVDFAMMPIKDEAGRILFLLPTGMDVTDRRQAEQTRKITEVFRDSEARFRQLADAMPQIVWAAQPDGTLDYYNRRWFDYINLNVDAFEKVEWDRYIHDDDKQKTFSAWNEALRTGAPYVRELRIRRADGQYRWFLVRALPIRDVEGTITRWFGTCTDIQDYQELQSEREYLLESERAARVAVEHASRMKDEFLATLSHELRTPLSAILGWTRLMRSRPMNREDLEKGLETIEKNARVQTQLIEDLLDMSRVISGKLRLDVQTVDPILFVEAAIETVMPAAVAKGIRIEKMIDPYVGQVSGDVNRLQQVMWNLLSNAIKFTPKDGKVQISLARIDSHIEISVADSGQGIAADFLPLVFDRFRQADSSKSRKYGGLGLGLAIVKQLVELHGGTVSVDSAGENQGSTFLVRLPLKAVYGDERSNHTEYQVTSTDWRKGNLAGLRVLVVDDEPDALEVLKRILEDNGAVAVTASSAAEALTAIQSRRPDVLVSDIGMPEVDGYEFLRRVKALSMENGAAIPAIALTAFARTEDKTKALSAGYAAHLAKPAHPSELIATIAEIAGRENR